MYNIKRNIKRCSKNNKTVNRTNSFNNQSSSKFKSNGLGKYKFPNCYEIPAGYYVAKIKEITSVKTAKNKDAKDVYFIIEDVYQCRDRIRKTLPCDYECKTYYIKQRYTLESQYYESFKDAMSYILHGESGRTIDIKDIRSLEFLISLSYVGKNEIGGIEEYSPINYDYFYDNTDEEDDLDTANEEENYETIDNEAYEEVAETNEEEDFDFDFDWDD